MYKNIKYFQRHRHHNQKQRLKTIYNNKFENLKERVKNKLAGAFRKCLAIPKQNSEKALFYGIAGSFTPCGSIPRLLSRTPFP